MIAIKNESGITTSIVLPVIVDGYKWECNKDRMWNLNELHKAKGLSESKEGANKQVISSQADSLIKISRIWADFFPANRSNQPI